MSALDFASPSPELVISAGAILPTICTVAVALRFWASHYPVKHIHVDDWLTVPALILVWAQGICLIFGTAKHALGYPAPDGVNPFTISTFETVLSRQLFYATILIQIPCITLVKMSFVFLYRRVFIPSSSRPSKFDTSLKGLAGILVTWSIAFFFSELFICRTRFEYVWISKTTVEQSQECVQLQPFDLAFTILDFLFDLLILLIPIAPLFRLNLSLGQKVGLCGVFSLGALAVGASITRFVVFVGQEDMSLTIAVYWTCVESAIALLACCLPPIFGLFNNMKRRRRSSHTSKNLGFFNGTFTDRPMVDTSRVGSDATQIDAWPGQNRIGVTTTLAISSEEMNTEGSFKNH